MIYCNITRSDRFGAAVLRTVFCEQGYEHNNHADQKELFMKGYNKMLETVEPSKIICYSEPFDEMTGEIIYIDYDLSSWQHYGDDVGKSFVINKTIMNTSDKKIDTLITKKGYITEGGGSAYGGDWIPKKESDERFIGKPGGIKQHIMDIDEIPKSVIMVLQYMSVITVLHQMKNTILILMIMK